jgi:hypothetical protein
MRFLQKLVLVAFCLSPAAALAQQGDDDDEEALARQQYEQQQYAQQYGQQYGQEYAQQVPQYGFMGPHPVPYDAGSGFCYQPGAHFHPYPPFDQYLFRQAGGWFYFVGDPGDFGYAQQMWGYNRHHPVPPEYGGGYCFIDWPHRHFYPPPASWAFSLVGGYYVYGGPFDPWYWRWRNHYVGYYGGYYRNYYYGGSYYRIRPPPVYRANFVVGAPGVYRPGVTVAAPGGGRVMVTAPPVRVGGGVAVGAPPARYAPPVQRYGAPPPAYSGPRAGASVPVPPPRAAVPRRR